MQKMIAQEPACVRHKSAAAGIPPRPRPGIGPATALGLLLLLLPVVPHAVAQTVPVPNPEFQAGKDRPEGWTLTGPGEWRRDGAGASASRIEVRGAGGDFSHWTSDPLPLEGRAVYRLDFRAWSLAASGGTPVSGPGFCNRDLGPVPETERVYSSIFTTPTEIAPERTRLRFGQWRVKGGVAFDSVRLRRAIPFFAGSDGVELGEGEIASGNTYVFRSPFGGASGNHSRPLHDFKGTYNTNRWVLSAGGSVVYRHDLTDRRWAAVGVTASVTWYAAGKLIVEAGTDGETWTRLTTLSGKGGGAFDLPPDLLPAPAVFVRLRAVPAEPGGRASLQVGAYGFEGRFLGEPLDLEGRTRFVAIDSVDPLVDVEIFGFALPDRMTLRTAFGFSPGNVWKYQELTKPADRRTVLAKYLESFRAHHISPYDPAPLDPVRVTWTAGEGDEGRKLTPAFDFSAWDAAMTRAVETYHFNTFRLSIPGMGGGSFHRRHEPKLVGYTEKDPEYAIAFGRYCREVEAHLAEKGWLDEAFVYWFDEPAPRDYAFVMNGFRKLARAAPRLRRMLTEQVEEALVGGPDIWCPVSPRYDHEAAEARRREGESFWWYVCTGPKAPYATLFIDHPATELRVWLWQTFARRIEGILVWQTNYWTSSAAYPDPARPQNPYEDPMGWTSGYGAEAGTRRPWGNGDGRFLYPPEAAADGRPAGPVMEGPVDSIRWEMLRDGIEDYEYLVMLRRLLDERGESLSREVRRDCEAYLDVPPAITRSMTEFTTDPAPIEGHRRTVARAIEALLGK